MLILILTFPLLGFLCGSLFGRRIGAAVPYINTFFIFLSLVFSITVLFNIIKTGDVYILNFMK